MGSPQRERTGTGGSFTAAASLCSANLQPIPGRPAATPGAIGSLSRSGGGHGGSLLVPGVWRGIACVHLGTLSPFPIIYALHA